MAKLRNFNDYLREELLDTEFAAAYLTAAMEENDEVFLEKALSNVVRVHGISKVASEAGIARQALYKMLSENGNPSYKNIAKILDILGMEIVFQNKKSS